MHLKYLLFVIVFYFLSPNKCFSQKKTIDSLDKLTYLELKKVFFNNKPDEKTANDIADYYIDRARTEKDTFHLAYGYVYKSYLVEYEKALVYTDSVVKLTLNYKNEDFPALGYMLKGFYHYDNGKDSQALELYLKAFDYALENRNTKQQIEIKQFVGGIKTIFGQHKQALDIFRKQLKLIKSQPDYKKNLKIDYYIALNDLSKAYLRGKILDSANIYINEGIDFSLKLKDTSMYSVFLLDNGTLSYYQKKYRKSLDTLKKVEPLIKDVSLANCFYYQGKIHKENNIHKTISYFKKIDSIYVSTNNPFVELKDVYKTMYDYYSEKNDIEQKLYAVDKLIKVDSILNSTIKDVNNQIIKEYEIPKLKAEKKDLLNLIEKERNNNVVIIYILILAVILILVLVVISVLNKRKYKRRFKKLLDETKTQKEVANNIKTQEENKKDKPIGVPKELIDNVLKGLIRFENEQKFLNHNMNLDKLAKEVNTNRVYLSKVLNHYKGISFTNYLNELRIAYCLKELNSNIKLKSYTIKAIASEVGFSHSESFSKAFHNQTGLKPSFYIKELNKVN